MITKPDDGATGAQFGTQLVVAGGGVGVGAGVGVGVGVGVGAGVGNGGGEVDVEADDTLLPAPPQPAKLNAAALTSRNVAFKVPRLLGTRASCKKRRPFDALTSLKERFVWALVSSA